MKNEKAYSDIYPNTTKVGREIMVLHEKSRNPHTSVMEKKRKKSTNIEHKKNHRLMKSLMENNITTPTDQRA